MHVAESAIGSKTLGTRGKHYGETNWGEKLLRYIEEANWENILGIRNWGDKAIRYIEETNWENNLGHIIGEINCENKWER